MAAPFPDAGVGTHHDDTSVVEDVTDIIYQITPEDKPFWMMSGETTARAPNHEWQRRELTTRQHNAAPEGFSYSFTTGMNTPTRIHNRTQIIKKEVRVSNTQVATDHYAISEPFADQMEVRLAEIGTDAEHALLRASLVSGTATDVSGQMQGLLQAIRSNATTYTDYAVGATLQEDPFNDHIQDAWDEGAECRDVLTGGKLKRRISSYTAGGTRFLPHDQGVVVNTVSIYESDFFPVQIHLSRDMLKAGDDNIGDTNSLYSGFGIAFIDRTMTRKAFLRRFGSKRIPETADSHDGVIVGEISLEWGHPSAHVYVDKAE